MQNKEIENIYNDTNIPWEKLKNTMCLITGATGLIGSLVVNTLIYLNDKYSYNINITIWVRNFHKAKKQYGDKVNYHIADILDSFENTKGFEYIIHCAAITNSKMMVENPVDTINIAVGGTNNILQLAQKSKEIKSIVYLSSMEIYGVVEKKQNPITEDKVGKIDLLNPRSSYPESKRMCETLCCAYNKQFNLPVKIVRLAQTFGVGCSLVDNRVAMQFAKSALKGEDLILHTEGKTITNFCYSEDAIRAIFTILLKGQNGMAYNVCNSSESRSIIDVAHLVCDDIMQGKIKVMFDIPELNLYGYANDTEMRLSAKRLEELGWKASVGMKEAYERLLEYLKLYQ